MNKRRYSGKLAIDGLGEYPLTICAELPAPADLNIAVAVGLGDNGICPV
jgi:hypothetical protein